MKYYATYITVFNIIDKLPDSTVITPKHLRDILSLFVVSFSRPYLNVPGTGEVNLGNVSFLQHLLSSSIRLGDKFQYSNHDRHYEPPFDYNFTLYLQHHYKIISYHTENVRDITLTPLLYCISYSEVPLRCPSVVTIA